MGYQLSVDKQLEVISFGEPMVEFNATTMGRLRDVNVFEKGFGGDTSNMIVALAKLNHSCSYLTKLGSDEFGRSLIDLWRGEKVDISHVLFEENGFTGIYFVSRIDEGKHEFTYYRKESAASHFNPDDLDMKYISQTKIFHTSGITQAISSSCQKAIEKVLNEVNREELTFTYDPNIRLRLWPLKEARKVVLETLKQSDIAFPSLEDAQTLFGIEKPEEIAKEILSLGCKLVVLKLGGAGCIIADEDEVLRVPSFKVEVIDTTGAGDAFDAGFLAATLEGKKPQEAAIFANAVAALKCLGKGAIIPQPRRFEVEKFINASKIKF